MAILWINPSIGDRGSRRLGSISVVFRVRKFEYTGNISDLEILSAGSFSGLGLRAITLFNLSLY
jgi:hypothetical protein